MHALFSHTWTRYRDAAGELGGQRAFIVLSLLRQATHAVALGALGVFVALSGDVSLLATIGIVVWAGVYFGVLAWNERTTTNLLLESIDGVSLRDGKHAVLGMGRVFAWRAMALAVALVTLSLGALPGVALAPLFGDGAGELASVLGMFGASIALSLASSRLGYVSLAILTEDLSILDALSLSFRRTARDADGVLFFGVGTALRVLPGGAAIAELARAERFLAPTSQVLDAPVARDLAKSDVEKKSEAKVSSAPAAPPASAPASSAFELPPAADAPRAVRRELQHITIDTDRNSLFPPEPSEVANPFVAASAAVERSVAGVHAVSDARSSASRPRSEHLRVIERSVASVFEPEPSVTDLPAARHASPSDAPRVAEPSTAKPAPWRPSWATQPPPPMARPSKPAVGSSPSSVPQALRAGSSTGGRAANERTPAPWASPARPASPAPKSTFERSSAALASSLRSPTLGTSVPVAPAKSVAPPPLPSVRAKSDAPRGGFTSAEPVRLPPHAPLPRVNTWGDRTEPTLEDEEDETTLPPRRMSR